MYVCMTVCTAATPFHTVLHPPYQQGVTDEVKRWDIFCGRNDGKLKKILNSRMTHWTTGTQSQQLPVAESAGQEQDARQR